MLLHLRLELKGNCINPKKLKVKTLSFSGTDGKPNLTPVEKQLGRPASPIKGVELYFFVNSYILLVKI